MKFTAKVDYKALGNLEEKIADLAEPVDKKQAQTLGKLILKEMKSLIRKGISPLQGKGKFPKYKGSYKDRIRKTGKAYAKKSPGGRARAFAKRLTPVNLKVSGHQMKSLISWTKKVKGSHEAIIGYRSKFAKDKELGHRERKNNQGFRPTIPKAPREGFARRIQDVYLKFYNGVINKQTKKRI